MEQPGNMGRRESDSPSRAVKDNRQLEILAQFSPQQQTEILYKQRVLSSLAYFVGKDFQIPVELNEPGAGWNWDVEENKIIIDPKDLLEREMDYLRFNISHEGGHRRISRIEDIPLDLWSQPGFSYLINTIEDPRVNNFVAEAYPTFRNQMNLGYGQDFDRLAKAKKTSGFMPRFMLAGVEYFRQWFNEAQGKDISPLQDLPETVREVVEKTIGYARDSWLRYPSKEEADRSEELIRRYAKVSYEINRDKIWPEFKRLIEEDVEDQEVQELLKQMQKKVKGKEGKSQSGEDSSQDLDDNSGEVGKKEGQKSKQDLGRETQSGDGEGQQVEGEGNSNQEMNGRRGKGLPQELKEKLTDKEQQELESAIEKSLEDRKAKGGKMDMEDNEGNKEEESVVDLDSLSEQLKQKIKEYIDSLPEYEKIDIEEKARKEIGDIERELNEELQGKLSDTPERKTIRVEPRETTAEEKLRDQEEQVKIEDIPPKESEDLDRFKELIEEELERDETVYENVRRQALPLIDTLEGDLREIFVRRRLHPWLSGFKTGKRIDIQRRMQESAKGVSAVESKAWQKRKLPDERDYAITLLVDLSHSMIYNHHINGAFIGSVVFAEALNRLSIKTEILGFNRRLYPYKRFNQDMSSDVRGGMGDMFERINTNNAGWTDQGWAVETASERLARQDAKEKFLIVLTDGVPEESAQHPRSRYELGDVVKRIMDDSGQKLIGLGVGENTEFVEQYYPNSIANIDIQELPYKVTDLLREVIANSDSF